MSMPAGWTEIAGGVALAAAAEPIHEAGHAIAARLLTGIWPQIGFWAVHPTVQIETKAAVLSVLAAGDAAVVAWWALVLLISRRPNREWVMFGPTFMVGLALLNWLAAAILTPFGYGHLGASDAAKFIAVSGLQPWTISAALTGIIASIAITVAKQVRANSNSSTI
jgi:hypothetical protein